MAATKTKPAETRSVTERLAKAVAHPVRLKAFTLLADRPASPKQIAAKIGVELGNVAYHVRVLEELEVIELVDTKQRRGSTEHFYRVNMRPDFSIDEWASLSQREREAFSLFGVQRAVADMTSALNERTFDSRLNRAMGRIPSLVDEEGWQEMANVFEQTFEEIHQVSAAVAARCAERGEAASIPVTAFLALFERPPEP